MKQICRLFIVVSFLFNLVFAVVVQTMYWTDWGKAKIQRANLDGSNVQDIVTGSSGPEGIALDVAGGKQAMRGMDRQAPQLKLRPSCEAPSFTTHSTS